MHILVTGASGFIGKYLIKDLLNFDFNINVISRVPKRNHQFGSRINVINKSLEQIEIEDLKNIEVIIHLASEGVSPKKASLISLEEINVRGSFRLMELAFKAGVRRFIAAGSCLEYGEEANNWDYIPPNALLKPICNYAKSKAKAFSLLNEFAIKREIEFFYGRIFSAYGDGQFEKNFWPLLKKSALAGNDFKMTSGDQIRDYIKVEKVARHFLKAIFRNDIYSFKPHIVNIGSGKGIKLSEFATNEWKKFNASGKLIVGGLKSRRDEIPRMVADTKDLKFLKNI